MKHYFNHARILFVVFALITHSLPAVVLSQEFKSLDISKNRVVLNKVLPSSPSDLNRTVKIPMSFTVLPDGTVGEINPLSKGDPSLEAISIKTLKKWKFNPIEDDIVMKGEITFTFSPDGRDNYTVKEKTLTLTNNKSDDSMQEKYYSVNHHHWGDFMNSHAVWIDTGTLSYEGILYKMMFSTEILKKGIYNYEYSADDSEDVLFDGNNLNNYIDNQNSEKGKLYLHEGIHKIQVAMRNSAINKQFWRDNPAGFAFTLTNERCKIVFSTRDEKHCYKKPNTPKFYPVSHPVWNDLLQRHAVWINNKENNHEGEYKDLTFETTIPKSGFYNFEISADDTAEFLLDGNKIMDISYQKGIHNFKIQLEEGVHHFQINVMNFTLYKSKWEDNAVGAAILVKDDSGNIVFSTRDEKHCYKEQIVNTKDLNIQEELKVNQPILEKNKLLNTIDDVNKLLFNSKWKVVYSYHGVDYLSKIQDKEYLKSTYTFNKDRLIVSQNDGSILWNSNYFISDFIEQSTEISSFKLTIPLTRKQQEFNDRKQDVYIVYIIDINTLKLCDSQFGSPCESHFTIKRFE